MDWSIHHVGWHATVHHMGSTAADPLVDPEQSSCNRADSCCPSHRCLFPSVSIGQAAHYIQQLPRRRKAFSGCSILPRPLRVGAHRRSAGALSRDAEWRYSRFDR